MNLDGMRALTVMLVDDALGVRQLIAKALDRSGLFEVVAEAGNGHQALALAREHSPQVVLLDLSMPVMDGLTALPLLHELLPQAFIVIFSTVEHVDLHDAVLAKGAVGVIDKGAGTPLREIPARLHDLCRSA